MDEQILIARVLAGDTQAAKALYDRHVAKVYRLAYRLTGDDALAQDLVQETFIRAFSRLAQFQGGSAFGTWLHTVATSVSLNKLRKTKQTQMYEVAFDDVEPVAAKENLDTLDLRVRIERAVDKLPDIHRSVFVMFDIEGYTHDEIATALGISTATSKVRLFRARSMLRTDLEDLVVEGRV